MLSGVESYPKILRDFWFFSETLLINRESLFLSECLFIASIKSSKIKGNIYSPIKKKETMGIKKSPQISEGNKIFLPQIDGSGQGDLARYSPLLETCSLSIVLEQNIVPKPYEDFNRADKTRSLY